MSKKQSSETRAARVPAVVTFDVDLVDGTFQIRANYADGGGDNYSLSPSDDVFNVLAVHGLKQYLSGKVAAHTKDAAKASELLAGVMSAIMDGNVTFGRKRGSAKVPPLVQALAEVKGYTLAEAAARLADKTTGYKLKLRHDPQIAAALLRLSGDQPESSVLNDI